MTLSQQILVSLLNSAIRNSEIDNIPNNVDWLEIFQLADKHQIMSLIYPMIRRLPDECVDPALVCSWRNFALKDVIDNSIYKNDTLEIITALNQANIPTILLKGIVIGNLYPNPDQRVMSDADILIMEQYKDKAIKILKDLGYNEDGSIFKHTVLSRVDHLTVEIHTKLLDEWLENRTSEWENSVWDNTIEVLFDNVPVRTLSVKDHLIFLYFHMVEHLVSSGFGLRQLCDLVLFIEHSRDIINWVDIFAIMKEHRMDKFMGIINLICRSIFSLEAPVQETVLSLDTDMVECLTDEIVSGGVFGRNEFEDFVSAKYLDFINKNNNTRMPSKGKRLLHLMFPPYSQIRFKYTYVNKAPFLLPVAWIHRFFANLFTLLRIDTIVAIKRSHKVYENRYQLLKWLDLI